MCPKKWDRMCCIRCTIILLCLVTSIAKISVPRHKVSENLKDYLLKTRTNSRTSHSTVGLIVMKGEEAEDLAEWFLKHRLHEDVIVRDEYQRNRLSGHVPFVTSLFCILQSVSDFESLLRHIGTYKFFRLDVTIQFIVSESLEHRRWLQEVASSIWDQKILNYVIVYELRGFVKVFSYNPFNNSFLNLTGMTKRHQLFPDRLENLHKYILHVAMYEDKPRNYFIEGRDVNMVKVIASELNASIAYVLCEDLDGVRGSLEDGRANFSFNKHFDTFEDRFVIQATYSVQMEYLIVVVPTSAPLPLYVNIFSVFDWFVWTILLVFVVLMIMVNLVFVHLTRFLQRSSSEAVLAILGIFLNIPYIYLYKARTSHKIFLMVFTSFSLLISTCFNTTLRSSLINPKYDKDIETLEELPPTNLELFYDSNYEYTIKATQLRNLRPLPKVAELIGKYNKSRGFILPKLYTRNLVQKRGDDNRFVYKTLKEYLTAGHSVYNFPTKSPFIWRIERLVMSLIEFDIAGFGTKDNANRVVQVAARQPLSLIHLQSVFWVIVLGSVFATVAFLVELVSSFPCYWH